MKKVSLSWMNLCEALHNIEIRSKMKSIQSETQKRQEQDGDQLSEIKRY